MRRRLFIIFLIICGLLTMDCGLVYAGDPVEKLARGITNVATSWVEIPKEIGRSVEKSGDFAGLFVGPFKGIAKAIGRTVVGVYDVVTFPIPLPRQYKPVIEPEFVFETKN